jgi:pSer/pThr/pTyr-binding forkhead associated (FHA) protein
VSDLKSTNGTLLNGARVTTAALVDGDELRVGETVLVFHSATRD